MVIPEAVQLVMHAAAHARGGEIFVLEMGEQILVADMARNLIRLSGYVPDQDIAIEYVGTRPGEKLYEELVGHDETVEPSVVEKIMRVRPMAAPTDLDARVTRIGRLAVRGETESLLKSLVELVPTYAPQPYSRTPETTKSKGSSVALSDKPPTA